MPTSTQFLPPPEESVQKNLWRLLQWAGMALVAMALGAGLGVWTFGPRMIGPALGDARIQAVNSRIRGVFEHTRCDLHWASPGTVEGLRLHDEQGQRLVHGNLVVPALSSSQWREGDLPSEAQLDLEELVLRFDRQGLCSLLDRLAPRSGTEQGSPFLDAGYLARAVHYHGTVGRLRLTDDRAGGHPLQLSNVQFDVQWEPSGASSLRLRCALPGGENGGDGEFRVDLQWKGMGAGFDLLSLQGTASLIGGTASLGPTLGLPRGLAAIFGSRLHLSLDLQSADDPNQGLRVTCKANGERLYVGRVDGFFDGEHWTFHKAITREREGAGEIEADLDSLSVMHSQAGYGMVLESLSKLFFPAQVPARIRNAPTASPTWSMDLIEFVSGVAPWPRHLPFLEGWLATCRMEWELRATGQHELAALADGPRAEAEPLETSTIRWRYDGEQGLGSGVFHAVPTDAQKREKRAVAIAVSGASTIGPLDFEELKLGWQTDGPYPVARMRPTEAQFKHLPSDLLTQLMGDLGWSLAQTFGSTFEVSVVRESVPGRDGSSLDGWRITLGGNTMQPENPIYLYSDGQAIWSEPGLPSEVQVYPGRSGGVFETWIQPCLPWFDSLGGPGDRVRVRFEDLVAEPGDQGWRITAGRFELADLEFDYSIAPEWKDFWGDTSSDLLFSAEFAVRGDRIDYAELHLPLGRFDGWVHLGQREAKLTLQELNEVSSSFLGLGTSLKRGSTLQGPFANLGWTVPLDSRGQ